MDVCNSLSTWTCTSICCSGNRSMCPRLHISNSSTHRPNQFTQIGKIEQKVKGSRRKWQREEKLHLTGSKNGNRNYGKTPTVSSTHCNFTTTTSFLTIPIQFNFSCIGPNTTQSLLGTFTEKKAAIPGCCSHLPLQNWITATLEQISNALWALYGPVHMCMLSEKPHVLHCSLAAYVMYTITLTPSHTCCACTLSLTRTHRFPRPIKGQLKHNTRWVNHFAVAHISPGILSKRSQGGHSHGCCIKTVPCAHTTIVFCFVFFDQEFNLLRCETTFVCPPWKSHIVHPQCQSWAPYDFTLTLIDCIFNIS